MRDECCGKSVIWVGDSKEVIRNFPKNIREDFGFALWQLQQGNIPVSSRPMPSIGRAVFELKSQDKSGWYRAIYMTKVKDKVFILHCFMKKSGKTAKNDLELAKQRYKAVITQERGS